MLNFLECSQFFLLTLIYFNGLKTIARARAVPEVTLVRSFFHVMIYIAFFSFLCCLKPPCFCYTLLVEAATPQCVFGVSIPDGSRWFLHVHLKQVLVYTTGQQGFMSRVFPLASCRFAELVVKQIERSATQGEEDMKTPWLSCQHHHHSTPD